MAGDEGIETTSADLIEQETDSAQENEETSRGLIERFLDLIAFLFFCCIFGYFMGVIAGFAGLGLFVLSSGIPIPFLVYDPTSPISFILPMIAIVIISPALLWTFSHMILIMKAQLTWSWKVSMLTGILVLPVLMLISSFEFFVLDPYLRILFPFQFPITLLLIYPPIPYLLLSSPLWILNGVLSKEIAYRVYSRFGCLNSMEQIQ
jgi:hypothetical protein